MATTTTNTAPVIPSPEPPAPSPMALYQDDAIQETQEGIDNQTAAPTEHDLADDEGTIAERKVRRQRATAAALVAPDLLESSK
eukprot:4290902-Pleurochrysis_carterae.AAC.2